MNEVKSWAIPVAALILAAAIVMHARYESHSIINALWVLDRLTGEVKVCAWGTGDSAADICRKLPRPR